jgi:hypothetical protein
MFAIQIDTLLFLLLIGIAALLRLLASKVGDTKDKSEEPPQHSTPPPLPSTRPIRHAAEETDADRIRKFLEALGQPPTTKPPPPVLPRTDVPPRPVAPVRPPPGVFPVPSVILTREERRKRAVIPREPARQAPQELFERRVYREEVALPTTVPYVSPPLVIEPPVTQVTESATVAEVPLIERPAEAYVAAQPTTESATPTMNIRSLLQSPAGLRNAVILREIFGPPRSLQPLDPIGV